MDIEKIKAARIKADMAIQLSIDKGHAGVILYRSDLLTILAALSAAQDLIDKPLIEGGGVVEEATVKRVAAEIQKDNDMAPELAWDVAIAAIRALSPALEKEGVVVPEVTDEMTEAGADATDGWFEIDGDKGAWLRSQGYAAAFKAMYAVLHAPVSVQEQKT